MPKLYDPDVVEMAKKCQDPSKDLWGFGQTLNRSDDGNGFMQNILWDYGGSVWDKDGKPALGTTFRKQNLEALQFSVDTIQKYKIQPPGVMGWTDVHNNEAYIAGKLVSTNNGASLYYAMVAKKNPIAEKTQVILTPGGPAGQLRWLAGAYNWGIFKKSKNAELCEDLIRWVEDEKRFDEYMKASIGQAGPVYKSRAENPYWKSDPNFEGMLQNVLRGVWVGYPGPFTPAAVEVQAQYILCDMAGRVRGGRALARGGAQGSPRARRGDLQDSRPGLGLSGTAARSGAESMATTAAAHPRQGRGPRERSPGPHRVGLRRWLGPDYRLGFLFILPIVVLVLALVAYPFCYALYLSMTRKYVGHAAGLRRLRELRQAHLRRVLPARRRQQLRLHLRLRRHQAGARHGHGARATSRSASGASGPACCSSRGWRPPWSPP